MTTTLTQLRTARKGLLPWTRSARPGRRFGIDSAIALAVVALVLAWAFFPTVFATTDPYLSVPADRLQPPSAQHWFGTDQLGRDLYSRVVHGSALTLQASAVAVAVAVVSGVVIGLIAGVARGRVDVVLMRLMDVLLSVPNFLLSLSIVLVLGFGTLNVAIAVGISAVAVFARVMRAEVLRVSSAPYVEFALASGRRRTGVVLEHILPNASGSVLALAGLEFGSAILSVSALSFLGYGATPPLAEWGSLVASGRDYLSTTWWLITLPGLVIAITVFSTNRVTRIFERTGGNIL